ncbi:hypothetical protein D1AOALGA4SA_9624 [Olavius algarvensis Delta 1 endosymbiont]|nr:hypothetical protein D1AOALGA4SA_9624 [Olavius algarvensis Delta 1 endosymbiont]
MKKNSGFTIMELMTVIGIIAIMASIIIPNVIGWLPKYRLRSGAEEIQSTLQLARLGAIKQNMSSSVDFNTVNHTFLASIAGQTIKQGKLPAGIIFDSVTNPGSSVQFDSRGLADDSSGSIQVRNSLGGTKVITVNIVGKTRIQ